MRDAATLGTPAHQTARRNRQVRRAWLFLTVALLGSVLFYGGLGGAAYWYWGHATVPESARVDVVQGDRAFIRSAHQVNWNAVPPATRANGPGATPTYLHEGDTLRTEEATHVLLTLWDGSTIEVFERSQLQMEELRVTQYISRSKAVSLVQTRGLVRVTPVADNYQRSRFQVRAGGATILMKEGGQRTNGGSFLVEVTLGADGESITAVRASVRRGVGAVRAGNQEVRLDANEQTTVLAGGAPGPPQPARRDLVANGTFVPAGDGGTSKTRFAPWQDLSTPGQADGPFGRLTPVQETIDGRSVNALELYRSLDNTDPAITGLRQPLDVTVADLASLELSADIKVLDQNVPGGGQADSEYPLIVRVKYRDASGAARERIWGFYVLPDPTGKKPANGQLVTAGQWTPLRVDLRALTPQPVRLDEIEVYASGHGYRARITNVTIVGAE